MEKSYKKFVENLPALFKKKKINTKDEILDTSILNRMALEVEDEYFYGIEKYPAFNSDDIKSILLYYFDEQKAPPYYTFDDRDKFGSLIKNIAKEIVEKDLRQSEQENLFDEKWNEYGENLQLIFNNNKRYYLNELDDEIRRFRYPELYVKMQEDLPFTKQEQRKYEDLTMWELREIAPNYEKDLRNTIFNNHKDAETGKYYCVNCGVMNSNRQKFEVDHIKPMFKGGKTVLENLQVLCIKCNRIKGAN